MARQRDRVRFARVLRALLVGGLGSLAATTLFEQDLGRDLVAPLWLVTWAPPALYLLLALVALRYTPAGRRLGWAVATCGVNACLGLTTALALSFAHPMSFPGAFIRALWTFAPAPAIHLVVAPLVMFAWRSRVRPRMTIQLDRSATPPLSRPAAPPLPTATPNWDAVMHETPTFDPGPAPFERMARQPERFEPERVPVSASAAVAVAAAPVAVAPAPIVAAPAPIPAAPAAILTAPAPAPEPPRPLAAPFVQPPPPPPDEPLTRISFDRIATQLPPDVFVLPPARLAESLREPGVLTVPSRHVLPHLADGAIDIPWAVIEYQFPEMAFALPQAEVRRRFTGWNLSLPMDEVLSQIPPEMWRVAGPAPDLSAIGQFPAPFAPGTAPPATPPAPVPTAAAAPPAPRPAEPVLVEAPVAPPAPTPVASAPAAVAPAAVAPAPAASARVAPPAPAAPPAPVAPRAPIAPALPPPAPVAAAPIAPAPVAPPAATPTPAVPRPTVAAAAAPAPVAMPRPVATTPAPSPAPAPVAAAPPAPAPVAQTPVTAAAPAAAPSPVVSRPPAAASASGPAVAQDEESAALARALSLCLSTAGALEWQTRRVAGRILVSFVAPALAREAIDALASRATALAGQLGRWPVDQLTIRTSRVVCVLTPLGARGWLAASVRGGGPVALVELLSSRARSATANGGADPVLGADDALSALSMSASPLAGANGSVAAATRALGAFGSIVASTAAAEAGGPSVYAFSADSDRMLVGVARVVHTALMVGHDDDALGRIESVALRRGRERAIVRPLRGMGGPAVLAAAGQVVLPGRAHRAAVKAAALLEAK